MPENREHIDLYELAGKQFAEGLSSSEHELLNKLLESPENLQSYRALEMLWQTDPVPEISVDVDAALSKVHQRMAAEPVHQPKSQSVRFTYGAWAAAASIVVVLAFYFLDGISVFSPSAPMLAFRADSANTQLNLADGSSIAINKGSEIEYPESFTGNTREVILNGEAFFDIDRNPDKPFIVHTQYADVRVLGTSFYVIAHPGSGKIEVSVETGRVEVIEKDKSEASAILEPGEAIDFSVGDTAMFKIESTPDNGFWRSRLLKFKRERLVKVARVVNKYYTGNLCIAPEIQDCRITASFEDKSLNEIVAIIAGTLDLKVEHTADSIYLHGPACN